METSTIIILPAPYTRKQVEYAVNTLRSNCAQQFVNITICAAPHAAAQFAHNIGPGWPPLLHGVPNPEPGDIVTTFMGWPVMATDQHPFNTGPDDIWVTYLDPKVAGRIGHLAVCSKGRIGIIEGQKQLPWGLSWVGRDAFDGTEWTSREPRFLCEEDAIRLRHLLSIYKMLHGSHVLTAKE